MPMISVPSAVKVFVYCLPTDMRKSFDGLHSIVTNEFGMDVMDGSTTIVHGTESKFLIDRGRTAKRQNAVGGRPDATESAQVCSRERTAKVCRKSCTEVPGAPRS
jgi:hypothetical protein